MKHYEPKDVRNVGLLSHGGAGKTSLGEAFLFNAKVSTRLCKVDEGNSNFDFEPEETKRKATINTAFGIVEWKKTRITLIDPPGDNNFFADTRNAAMAMDAGIVVVSAVDGVEVGTERVWDLLNERDLPRAVFINKLDRERADFARTLADVKENLNPSVVALTLPIGAEAGFKGIVNLLTKKALVFQKDGSGAFSEAEIPADMKDEVEEAWTNLIEGIAETDEALMNSYLENGALSGEEMAGGIAKAMAAGNFIPVLCGTAVNNVGVQPLMDLVADAFPNPLVRGEVHGKSLDGAEELTRQTTPDAPFSAFVFKTIVDPFAGRLTIFRVMSGKITSEGTMFNSTLKSKESYNRLFLLQGKKTESISAAQVGDIVAIAKFKEAKTAHTFCDAANPIVYAGLPQAPPSIAFAIKPRTQGDEDKVALAVNRLLEEDPLLQVTRDEETKEIVLQGSGQVHIEVLVERMKRVFNVDVDLSLPKVPYRETIKAKVTNVEGKHKKQTGGRGQFAVCYIDMEPLPRGSGFVFENDIFGGSIPKQWVPAVEKGIADALPKGPLAGYPVVDFKVRLFDGKFHAVDSSEMAFKIAGSLAFKAAMEQAKPTLLEPVMTVEIVVPEEYMGDIMGDVNSRRGRILGMEPKGKNQVIKAHIPLAEMLRYAPDLRSMTGGRGTFTMEMSHYEEVPAMNQEKIIEEAKAAREE
jgi:elongation factor G